MSSKVYANTIALFLALFGHVATADSQVVLEYDAPSFNGAIHDNTSNKDRQGSGLNPFVLKAFPDRNLFRDDAVGFNFEHVFNGAKAQHGISMFTPREDVCHLKKLSPNRYELRWPAEESQWGIEARMEYDFSVKNQVDLYFECTPTKKLFSQEFVAMMWASYMKAAMDRKIHFWGRMNEKVGWVRFGEGEGKKIEVGTIAHFGSAGLPHEPGAQTLNLFTNSSKRFIAPFYYGILDGDQNFETKDDPLLFLVLFDQTDSIRFAMWNFFLNEQGNPDTHSPAWDWQFIIRNPRIGERYRYRARVVVKPFEGVAQVTDEYRRWRRVIGKSLPTLPNE